MSRKAKTNGSTALATVAAAECVNGFEATGAYAA